MKIYVAAIYTNNLALHGSMWNRMNEHERGVRRTVRDMLDSYHYVHRQRAVDMMRKDAAKVFLDSGAFSAYSLGATIDLEKYCEYILANRDIIVEASVLDGIGDPLKTWQNQRRMEQLGTKPLPCFHYGEDERYLEHYVASYPYITLGGMVPVSTEQLIPWLDRMWNRYLTDKDGLPKLKVHGFGLTRNVLLRRYPWYSVDSSSWIQSARTGGVVLRGLRNINISFDSPRRKEFGQHINTLTPIERERVVAEIRGRGYDETRLSELYVSRYIFNMQTYAELSDENAPPKPFSLAQEGFFD